MANGHLATLMKLCSSAALTPQQKNKPPLTSKVGFKFFPDMNPTICQMISWFFEGIFKVGIPMLAIIIALRIGKQP